MKLSIFFLSLCMIQLNAENTYSQTTVVHIQKSTLTLQELIAEIESQTDFLFIFSKDDIDVSREMNIKTKSRQISDILRDVFANSDITYKFVEQYITLRKMKKEEITQLASAPAQNPGITITGTVKDVNGEPVIGANIVEKGSESNGTISNLDGRFTLEVSPGATLVVSYIGYNTQEVAAGNRTGTIHITLLENALALEEIVVVGYGTARRKDLTGSIVRADLTALQESPNVSLLSGLHGTVPGLNVNATTQAGHDPGISIRGRNSISGGTGPLIVLDGIIYRGSIVDINPNDIESVDILKDASAAAIYGSQASNGVMLITSKTVKAMSKPVIEYNGSYTLQGLSSDKMTPMNREEFLQFIADGWLSESRTGEDMLTPNPSWNVANHLDGSVINGYLNGTDTDWWGLLTNDQPYIQQHNLSVRGRSELSSYFMSIGYTDQQNLVINDTYQRYNVRMNLDTKITSWLKLGTQSFFSLSDYSGVAPSLANVIKMPPIAEATNRETGEYIVYPYTQNKLNPILETQQDNVNKRYNLFGNFYADVDIPFIKGLNYRLNFSQNMIFGQEFLFNPYGSNLQGEGSKKNSSTYTWSADHIVTYKRQFGKHGVNATFVYGAEKRQYEDTDAKGNYYANDALGYNYLQAAELDQQRANSEAWQESSLYTMLRLAYTFNDRYNFTGTLRRDGFSGFGKSNKFALFPSAAVSWNISEEGFLKDNAPWMDNLKLRASYGANGNRTVSRYETMAKITSMDAYQYGDGGSVEKGMYVSAMANNNLKWETTRAFNAGLDFSVLNGRLSGVVEYYRTQTHNLLYNIDIPTMNPTINSVNTDLSRIPVNIGKLANRGVEVSLSGIPVQTKDFSWTVTFNYSLNRNKVVSILGLDNDGDGKEDDLVSSKIFIGHPYGVRYDFELIGMWQVADYNAGIIPSGFTYGSYKVRDIDGDGAYSQGKDRKILGYNDPSYRFSIQNNLTYKNLELKIFINSIQGGKDYYYGQSGYTLENPDNMRQNNLFKFDYWTPENPNARYRQPGFLSNVLEQAYSPYIQRNFIRLQNLTLSYRLPSAFLKKYGINNLKVYASGENLFTITDWDGWDPETGTGLEADAYPLLKTYSVGINFDF
jgi:TonB-linked SusC/RagA family outer membrane protein